MNLLTRIALSDGDPQRTIQALRLILERLEREVDRCPAHAESASALKGLLARWDQVEDEQTVPRRRLC
jgi:hypothetical protein